MQTVKQNSELYPPREVIAAKAARRLIETLGFPSSKSTIELITSLINNAVSSQDVTRADRIFGPAISALKGKTTQRKAKAVPINLAEAKIQIEQVLEVDIFFVKGIIFLLGVFSPLDLAMVHALKRRTASCIADGLQHFTSLARQRGFNTVLIRSDNEGGIAKLKLVAIPGITFSDLNLPIDIDLAGPGKHVPRAERRIRTIKERVRVHEYHLPFVMTTLTYCVYFCVSRLNLLTTSSTTSGLSATERFIGRKINASRDLRTAFGDYVQATEKSTDNSIRQRTAGCIALLPTGNLMGSVKVGGVRG